MRMKRTGMCLRLPIQYIDDISSAESKEVPYSSWCWRGSTVIRGYSREFAGPNKGALKMSRHYTSERTPLICPFYATKSVRC